MLDAQNLVTKFPKKLNFVVEHITCSFSVRNVLHVTPASTYHTIHAI